MSTLSCTRTLKRGFEPPCLSAPGFKPGERGQIAQLQLRRGASRRRRHPFEARFSSSAIGEPQRRRRDSNPHASRLQCSTLASETRLLNDGSRVSRCVHSHTHDRSSKAHPCLTSRQITHGSGRRFTVIPDARTRVVIRVPHTSGEQYSSRRVIAVMVMWAPPSHGGLVGLEGFEPPTMWSGTTRSDLTELQSRAERHGPDLNRRGLRPPDVAGRVLGQTR